MDPTDVSEDADPFTRRFNLNANGRPDFGVAGEDFVQRESRDRGGASGKARCVGGHVENVANP